MRVNASAALYRVLIALLLPLAGCEHRSPSKVNDMAEPSTVDVYALESRTLEGQAAPLSQYRGQVTLFVNVASACGYTPQYAGLQKLYERYKPQGFAVLGFPSNDFGRQEPGSAEQIREFCSTKYRVNFPMLEKVQTKPGAGQSPVYAALQQSSGELPSWNFGKYLISRAGKVLRYFPSDVTPEDPKLTQAIESALATGS